MAARSPRPRSARAQGRPTPKQRTTYLDALRGGSTIKQAAAAAGRDRFAFVHLRRVDEAFATAHDEAYDEGADVLEAAAFERAVEGVVTYRHDKDGNTSETVTYSDRLLELLLKAKRPKVYRDNSKVEHVGGDGPAIKTEVTLVDTDAVYRGLVDAGVIQPGPSAAADAAE
jgi:hypothetical protein